MRFALAALVVATLAGPHIAAAQVAPAVADPEALRSVGPSESGLENDYFDRLTRGRLDAAAQRAMWESARAMPAEPASVSAVNTWQLVGPIYATNPGGGRVTGRVRDIDAHNVRVLGSSGGLWRFSFGAVAMSDSVPATWFGSFATSPSDPNTILIGTGEYKSGSGTGLFRSTDGGVTWNLATMPQTPNAFTRVRYSPDGSVVHAASDVGYFRSVDGGPTWARKLTGAVTDVCVVTANPGIVFATISNQGLWRSNDAGQTWAQVGAGLPTSGTGDGAVTAIMNGPALWIYVVLETAVYRSTDGGASWINVSPSYTVSDNFMGPVISVCPTDPNTVLMGNVALNRTTDGGATWAKIVTPDLHADFHAFAWDDNGVGVWAGEDGGWSHSTDKGLDWDSTDNVMPITQFYTVDCEKTETGYMLGGTQDNNVLFTPTEALFWTDPVLGSSEGDAYGVTLNQYTPSQMWGNAGLAPGSYAFPHFRSLDGGASWQPHDTGIPPNSYAASLRTDNAFPVHVFTSVASYVYESTDSGATWVQSNPTPIPYAVQNLTVSQRVSGGAVLYATTPIQTAGQRLYVRDNGVWSERSSSLPDNEQVWKVVPHPWAADASEAWAILHDFTTSQLYHTTDRGLTWTNVTGDFPPNIPITDLVPNPHASNELYVGTYLGCWRSLNGGTNWERWTNGMPPTAKVTEMTYIDLTASGGPFSIVAATYGRSVWKRDVIGADPQPSLSVGNAACVEGNSGTTVMEFPVTLSAPQGMPVYVGYATANGSALAGSDYQAASGTVTIPAGQTTAYVSVLVNGDTAIEPDETFTLTLSNPVRATIASGTATGTIEDDDARALVDRSAPIVDGTVNALVLSGDSLFVGGAFSHIGSATGGAVPFDSTTGQPAWLPQVAGSVQAVAPDGAGGWYLGGSFSAVGGVPRQNLAHVLADHSVASWNPAPNGIVFALVVSNGSLYVGGGFTMMGAITRNDLAAFDLAGNMRTWDPEADGTVVSLAIGSNVLYAGGDFTHVGGAPRSRVAALDLTTGAATAWNPGANDEVASLALSAGTLYLGGSFDTLATQVRHKLAAVDATTGALAAWNPGADGQVLALVPNGASVFVGGAFSTIGNVARPYLAALDATSGAVTAWNPNADLPVFALARSGTTLYAAGDFLNVGGQPRGYLAALDVTTALATTWDPEPNAAVVALALQGGTVMAGGAFDMLGAQARANLAAISVSTGQVLGWNPGADGTVNALALSGHTLYVGGTFGNLGGQPRARIGAVDAGTGLATTFNPGANARVWTLLPIGTSVVIAGGQFTSIGGLARNAIASLSTSSGAATTWNPNANGIVGALATDGTYVYAGGSFTGIGGAARSGLAALNASTGAAISTWNPAPNGATTSLQEVSGSLVVTGAFTTIAGLGRGRAAILNPNGTVSTWNPAADGVIDAFALSGTTTYVGGSFNDLGSTVPRHRLGSVSLLNNTVTNWPPEPNNTVNALVTVGSVVWAGGSFTAVAGLPQAHLARLIPVSGVDAPGPTASPSATLALDIVPNPTRGALRVRFAVPGAARVRVGFYDVNGRRVAPAIERAFAAGVHELLPDVATRAPLAPGLYFVRLDAGDQHLTRRFAVVR